MLNYIKMSQEIMVDSLRDLTIITWGKLNHKDNPTVSDYDINVCNIANRNNLKGIDTKKVTGRNKELREKIMSSHSAITKLIDIVRNIEKNSYKCISIYCDHGRHRSISMAKSLKEKYYKNAKIIHLDG
jgi:RNase adaptor protein for sRNA GlmZ degradation